MKRFFDLFKAIRPAFKYLSAVADFFNALVEPMDKMFERFEEIEKSKGEKS